MIQSLYLQDMLCSPLKISWNRSGWSIIYTKMDQVVWDLDKGDLRKEWLIISFNGGGHKRQHKLLYPLLKVIFLPLTNLSLRQQLSLVASKDSLFGKLFGMNMPEVTGLSKDQSHSSGCSCKSIIIMQTGLLGLYAYQILNLSFCPIPTWKRMEKKEGEMRGEKNFNSKTAHLWGTRRGFSL